MNDPDLEEQVGRTLMVGLPGAELDHSSARRLTLIRPGGVIFFRRNLETPSRLAALVGELRRLLGYPLLLAIDQEGGRVSRLEPWIGGTPSGQQLARSGVDTIRAFATATARALRALGLNVDFAPVVDLGGEDASNGIGDRSFGKQADEVTAAAGAFLEGLQAAGLAGCLKHFPGLGPTIVDSHAELPVAHVDRSGLEEHLRPFRALAPRASAIMVSHAHYPALDRRRGRPASLSAPIVRDLLRGELGYRGLVVGDDMEMGAVAPSDRDGQAAVKAIEAGCDLLLYCASLDRAETAAAALLSRASRRPETRQRISLAAGAVIRAAELWPASAPNLSGWDSARLEIEVAVAQA